jgi:hypothetical protein
MRLWATVLVMVIALPAISYSQEVEPCAVETPSTDEVWRLVRADGFTFCVPPDWAPVGKPGKDGFAQHRWRSGPSSITWTRGQYTEERESFSVSRDASSMPRQPRQPDIRRTSERIGGGVAEMWTSDLQSSYRTGAVWESPSAIYFLGEARRRDQAQLHLDIYRTVRFALPDGGE